MYRIEVFVSPDALNKLVVALSSFGKTYSGKHSHYMSWYKVQSMWYSEGGNHTPMGGNLEAVYEEEYCVILRCEDLTVPQVVDAIKTTLSDKDVNIDIIKIVPHG